MANESVPEMTKTEEKPKRKVQKSAKQINTKRRKIQNVLIRILAVIATSTIAALNLNTFVRPGGLYPGGLTGLTVLLQTLLGQMLGIEVPFTVINLTLNAVPIYIGFRFVGKKFSAYSCAVIVLTSVLTDLLPGFVITYDTLLISVFGGLIGGFAASICLLSGTSTGGTDFISIYFSTKKGVDVWNYIFAFNCIILGAAGILFGWDKALYSIIFQFVQTQVLGLLYRRYQKQTMFIVTKRPDIVCWVIKEVTNHAATILSGTGAYENEERFLVYSVVGKDQARQVRGAILKADPEAFVNEVRTDELAGKFYQSKLD